MQEESGDMDEQSQPIEYRQFASLLTHGKLVRIALPAAMTAKDYEFLIDWIDLLSQADGYILPKPAPLFPEMIEECWEQAEDDEDSRNDMRD